MTLRVALVLDGDAERAKKAVAETGDALDRLGARVEAAGKASEQAKGKFDWGDAPADSLKQVADAGKNAAEGLGEAASAGGAAAPNVEAAGVAAGAAAPKFSSLKAAVGGLAAGFAAGLGVGLLVSALDLAIGKAGDLVAEITSNQPSIERDLKAHAELVKAIRDAYAEAEGAASSYGNNSAAILRFEAQQDISRLTGDLDAATRDLEGRGGFNALLQDLAGGTDRLGPLRDEVNRFRQDIKDGTADIIDFRDEIGRIAEALPADSPYRRLSETILEDTEQAAKIQEELSRARDLLDGLRGDADAAATALGGSAEKYDALGTAAAGAVGPVAGTATGIADTGEAAGAAAPRLGDAAGGIRDTGAAATEALPALRELKELLDAVGGGRSPARAAVTPIFEGREFASGGFTGHGPETQVAGFVHGREYVFDAASTAAIGVANLDAIRAGVRGYATGGAVGTPGPAGGAISFRTIADDLSVLRGSVHELVGSILRGTDVMEALAGVVQSVADKFLDFALRALDSFVFSGGGGGIFGFLSGILGGGAGYFPPAPGAGLYHAGGIVGPLPAVSRPVHPAVFAGAPRMHSGGTIGGLFPGERPVIAMEGEEIGWPEDLARKYGAAPVINNFNITTPNPRAFAESRATVARASGRFLGRIGRFN